MGKYKAQGKIYGLRFEDIPELEVGVAAVSLGKLFDVADQADRARAGAGLAEVMELVELFASRLRTWNLIDEDDQDIPPTVDGFLSVDADDALLILVSWYEAMTGRIEERLGKASTSGATFPEQSIPMAVA